MNEEQRLNNAAATAVLGWKPDSRCVGVFAGQKFRGSKLIHCACGHCHQVNPGCATSQLHVHDGSHVSRAPDMTLPENVVKMIEWLASERDVEVIEDGEKYLMPERWEPEMWFVGRLWHIRHQSWAEIQCAPTFTVALQKAVVACAELGGAQ